MIKSVRVMKRAGILADIAAKDAKREFRRFNLIYGFNGSGKSTLSRILAALQNGKLGAELPEDCSFEIEMGDGSILGAPDKLAGAEKVVCVFNEDFVERHLRWSEGTANSIFYISETQADLAQKLKDVEEKIPAARAAAEAEQRVLTERQKAFALYKREKAKALSAAVHMGTTKYEANHLQADFDNIAYEATSKLSMDALASVDAVARLSSALPPLPLVEIAYMGVQGIVDAARYYAELSIGAVVLDEMEKHPSMVPWLKHGHDYHSQKGLDTCLLCGSALTKARQERLTLALDERIARVISEIDGALGQAQAEIEKFSVGRAAQPKAAELALPLQTSFLEASTALREQLAVAWELLTAACDALQRRKSEPTKTAKHELPSQADAARFCEELRLALAAVNDIIGKHNTETRDFEKHQASARLGIKRHYLAEWHGEYTGLRDSLSTAEAASKAKSDAVTKLQDEADTLRAQVREHGPAADKISRLVRSYLGHGELTIHAAAEGYELHRHGKLVKGPPSEGERTAIALCYFLSTLESDGRDKKDLIVVVDDPISSLDTKAMNYACVLIRNLLTTAKQVFVLTHNQSCMNEFKKAWKNRAYPEEADKQPTATLNYLDVKIDEATGARSATLIELPKLLRTYDSEYHFLCQKLIEFEKAGDGHSDYHFLMPNVMRRVLEVFLAFKVPGSHGIKDKLNALCADLADQVDQNRLGALERLAQVESHSDSLDDLIGHSSMTIEEARQANEALLHLMKVADERHEKAIRKQCKAA